MYAAALYEGVSIDFGSLLREEYLNSERGSNFEQLKRALTDHGLAATPVSNLSEDLLLSLKRPVILHVAHEYNSKSYDHYLVCLRTVGTMARVLDGAQPIESVPVEQLLLRSDKNGILVSAHPGLLSGLIGSCSYVYGGSLVGAAALLVLFLWLGMTPDVLKSSKIAKARIWGYLNQSAIVLLGCVTAGVVINTMYSKGLFASPSRQAMLAPVPAAEISISRLKQLVRQRPLIRDARHRSDFIAGHIAGAMNIPVETSDEERRALLASVPRDQVIVAYCESSRCAYVDLLAAGLRSDGFNTVFIYRGGWDEWSHR